ncbi:MAG: lipopolysaccharide biosynthesis protein, partial [Brevundimonas sp.]
YFGQAFTLGRKTKNLLAAMAIPAGANVILNLILVPRFGLMGAAWATAASFALGLLATMALGRRVLALPVPWEALVRCGVATAVMAVAVSLVPPLGGIVELILAAGVGVIVYAAVALTINAAGVRDVALRLIARRRAGKAPA